MAKAGKEAKVMVGASTMGGSSTWGFTPGTRTIDVTAHQDDYEQMLILFRNGAGQITAFYDDTDTAQDACIDAWVAETTVTLKLYLDATRFWTFDAYIESMPFSAPIAGAVVVVFNFRSSGAITKPA